MTMTQSEQLKHGPQEKWLRKFHQDFNLNEPAELQQQLDVQWHLLKDQRDTAAHERDSAGWAQDSQYSKVTGWMEKHIDRHGEEAQLDGERVPQKKPLDGCVDHLLILAQSAEIVAQSEDGLVGMLRNNQNIGPCNNLVDQMAQENVSTVTPGSQECSQEVFDNMSANSHVSSQKSEFCNEVTRPRLTQNRKQARCKYLLLDEEKIEDTQCKHMHGETIRLSQMKHQARCKGKNVLLPQEMILAHRIEQPHGRITRLSQMKHQARSKEKSTVKEGTEEHIYEHLHCNRLEGNQIKVASSEGQKKAQPNDSNLCGVPSHKFFSGVNHSSVEKVQGHLASNYSSGLIYRHHQHIQNALPVQNDLREDPRIVALQRRTEQIEGKRTSKDKQQFLRNPVQNKAASMADLHHTLLNDGQDSQNLACTLMSEENSEAQKEFVRVKGRMRLTQLRREVRLGTGIQCSVMQGPGDN